MYYYGFRIWPPRHWLFAWQRWRNERRWLAHRKRYPVVSPPRFVFEVPEEMAP